MKDQFEQRRTKLSPSKQALLNRWLQRDRQTPGNAVVPQRHEPMRRSGASALVAIESRGSRLPFYCVHPVEGGVGCYRDLTSYMPGQPFYGLQEPAISDETEPFGDIPKMAGSYVRDVLEHQPVGPYFLGGFSFGGIVALEMAQQLTHLGREVALLALIDAPLRCGPNTVSLDEVSAAVQLAKTFNIPVNESDVAALPGEDRVALMFRRAKAGGAVPEPVTFAHFSRFWNVFMANIKAMAAYQPRPYAGKAALLVAQDKHSEEDVSVEKFRAVVVGELEVHVIPGDHLSLLKEPNVRCLGEALAACLRRSSKEQTTQPGLP